MNTRIEFRTQEIQNNRSMPMHAQTVSRLTNSQRLPNAVETLLSMLDQLAYGQIIITLPNGHQHVCGQPDSGPVVDMVIHDWRVFGELLTRGDIGGAECFMDGLWGTDSLAELLTLIAKNRDVLHKAIHGRRWRLLSEWVLHRLRANTRRGSRRNIMAHYDLGNTFYETWLDETMTYSSALFPAHRDPDLAQWNDLPAAQRAKNNRIINALNLQAGDRVLEIGSGWGGFAEQATARGAHITGLTLSPAQKAFAEARAKHGGWANQAEFLLTDYRDMNGQFDHIVSIEMFEAVGERWWPIYFKTVKRLLKPGGRAVIQVITIDRQLFSHYRRNTDFIQQHVFPGGMLPSPEAFCRQAERVGLKVSDDLTFGSHYARTLALWHEAFSERLIEVKAQGFDDRFIRLWRFYLAYCEAGFRARSIDVHQFTLQAS